MTSEKRVLLSVNWRGGYLTPLSIQGMPAGRETFSAQLSSRGNKMFIGKDISKLSSDGRFLYVDMRPRLDVYLKYAPWEDGLMIERYNGEVWELENRDPNLLLITPEHEADPCLPVHAFIESIPADIRAAAVCFDHLQSKVLQLLAKNAAALDLLRDIPMLLWLVADWAQAPDVSNTDVKALLKNKRALILSKILGRQCSQIDIRFLKKIKIVPSVFTNRHFNFIKHYIFSDRAADFQHWRDVPYDALVILKNHQELVSCRFVRHMADMYYTAMGAIVRNRKDTITLISDTLLTGANLGVANPMGVINRCESLADLQALHNKWVRKFNVRKMIIRCQTPFPAPPIPGNLKIQPIRNEGELINEGKLMHHCVGGYGSKIHNGTCYIYRVLKPERATLEILGSGKSVRIGQLNLACNQVPLEETLLEVARWIENFRKNYGKSAFVPDQNEHPPMTETSARRIVADYYRDIINTMDDVDIPWFEPRNRA